MALSWEWTSPEPCGWCIESDSTMWTSTGDSIFKSHQHTLVDTTQASGCLSVYVVIKSTHLPFSLEPSEIGMSLRLTLQMFHASTPSSQRWGRPAYHSSTMGSPFLLAPVVYMAPRQFWVAIINSCTRPQPQYVYIHLVKSALEGRKEGLLGLDHRATSSSMFRHCGEIWDPWWRHEEVGVP